MAAMDPIDITSSSDSDFDFDDDRETDTSPVGESVAFANSRILPPWPSTSGTNSKSTSKQYKLRTSVRLDLKFSILPITV